MSEKANDADSKETGSSASQDAVSSGSQTTKPRPSTSESDDDDDDDPCCGIVDLAVLLKWDNNRNAPHVFAGLTKLVGKEVINAAVQVLHHWNEHKSTVWRWTAQECIRVYGDLLLDMDSAGSKRALGGTIPAVSSGQFAEVAAKVIGTSNSSCLLTPHDFLVAWLKEFSRTMNNLESERPECEDDRISAANSHKYFLSQKENSWASNSLISQIKVDMRCTKCNNARGNLTWRHEWTVPIEITTGGGGSGCAVSVSLADLILKQYQIRENAGVSTASRCDLMCDYREQLSFVILPSALIIKLNRHPNRLFLDDSVKLDRTLRLSSTTQGVLNYRLVSCIYRINANQYGVIVFEGDKSVRLVDEEITEANADSFEKCVRTAGEVFFYVTATEAPL